jgi:hypothetical protein
MDRLAGTGGNSVYFTVNGYGNYRRRLLVESAVETQLSFFAGTNR